MANIYEIAPSGNTVEAARRALEEAARFRLRGFVCPLHQTSVKELKATGGAIVGETLTGVKLTIQACCENAESASLDQALSARYSQELQELFDDAEAAGFDLAPDTNPGTILLGHDRVGYFSRVAEIRIFFSDGIGRFSKAEPAGGATTLDEYWSMKRLRQRFKIKRHKRAAPAKRKPRRLKLTKAEQTSEAGTELLALCETITADGSLRDDEVRLLKEWAIRNSDAPLPAHEYLLNTLLRVVADRRITETERVELYHALESVLPKAIRSAVERRRLDSEEQRRQEELKAKSVVEARDGALGVWDFVVAGSLYEGRPAVIAEHAREGDSVFLVRDPFNAFSRNAIEVRLKTGAMIGYVPEDFAHAIAPLLDAGNGHVAKLTRIIAGSRAPVPVVVASLHRPDAEVPHLVRANEVPAPIPALPPTPTPPAIQSAVFEKSKRPKVGCILPLVLLTVVVMLL